MNRADVISGNLDAVRRRIEAAAHAASRDLDSVRLLAVSKKMPPEDVLAALQAGQDDFGENYAQELRDKRAALLGMDPPRPPRWHYIGPLQTNKVKYVAGQCALLHSLDSLPLLQELNRRVPDGIIQDCLIQVNIAGEPQKRGVLPEGLPPLLDAFAGLPRLHCRGLMVIPPLADDPEASRPHFAGLRHLRDQEAGRGRDNVDLRELSMGMSDDLDVAISEGATLVRVGTAIFGARPT